MGQDQTLVYVRRKEEIEDTFPFQSIGVAKYRRWWNRKVDLHLDVANWVVGFCGKIYPIIEMHKDKFGSWNKPVQAFCYTKEEVDQFVQENYKENIVRAYHGNGHHREIDRLWPRWVREDKYAEHFQWFADRQDAFADMFVEKGQPIFIAKMTRFGEKSLIWNGCLKEVEFFRIFDTYTAFQELAMYVGGLATPQKPIPDVPDKTMVGAKGFDEKWSFRKEPSKKRK